MYDLVRNEVLEDWGDWRVRLHPDPGTKMPAGRTGEFFLHGGSKPDTIGCIDVGGGIWGNDTTNQLKRDILTDPDGKVPLVVQP